MKSYVKKLNKLILMMFALIVYVLSFVTISYASSSGRLFFEAISDSDSKPISKLEIAVFKIGLIGSGEEYFLDSKISNILDSDKLENCKEDDINKIVEYVKVNYEPYLKFKTDNNGKYIIDQIEDGIYIFIQNDSFNTCRVQNVLAYVKFGETSTVKPKIVNINTRGSSGDKTSEKEEPPKGSDSKEDNSKEDTSKDDNPQENTSKNDDNDIEFTNTEIQTEEITEIDLIKEKEKLPNTGILYWPIPICSILGILVFAIGWYILFASNINKKKIGISIITISLVLILVAGAILIYNNIENNRVLKENLVVVEKIEKEINNNLNNVVNNINIEEQNQQVENINNEVSNTYFEYDGDKYVGILYIPSLNNLRIPVLAECTDINLKKSICKYSGNIDDKLVIAGHNYKSIFGKLLYIENLNEIVYLRTLNGEFIKYKLSKIEDLEINEVKKMKEEPYDLTLFTCTYDSLARKTLRFVKV